VDARQACGTLGKHGNNIATRGNKYRNKNKAKMASMSCFRQTQNTSAMPFIYNNRGRKTPILLKKHGFFRLLKKIGVLR
jgi:hypothetical protein